MDTLLRGEATRVSRRPWSPSSRSAAEMRKLEPKPPGEGGGWTTLGRAPRGAGPPPPPPAPSTTTTTTHAGTAPVFGYSQKNFHIADGNLYSILSPVQSRKLTARPSFLRSSSPPIVEVDAASTPEARAPQGRQRRLKFHRQGVPPQYRTTWVQKPLSEESGAGNAPSRPDDKLDLTLGRRWDALGDAFVASHQLRKSRARRSFFDCSDDEEYEDDEDDEDDDDEDEPLNLCLADHAKRQQPKSFSVRVKREPADNEGDCRRLSPFSAAQERFERRHRELLASSPFVRCGFADEMQAARSRAADGRLGSHTYLENEAMDLTFQQQQQQQQSRSTHSFHSLLQERSIGSLRAGQTDATTDAASPFKLCRGKKVPYISQMLENMSLWDEDARLQEKRCEPGSFSGKRKSHSASWTKLASAGTQSPEGSARPQQLYVSTADFVVKPESCGEAAGGIVPSHHPRGTKTSHAALHNTVSFLPGTSDGFGAEEGGGRAVAPDIRKTSSMSKLEARPKNKVAEGLRHSRSGTVRCKRLASVPTGEPPPQSDINICKFKLIKGVQPMLEEKKSIYVALPRSSKKTLPSEEAPRAPNAPVPGSPQKQQERFRTYKIHVGSQEELGRKLAAGKKSRRRSRKALVREKLEATFREQGFLIKTQQVSSAEGAVYCKFRQLKKFTRYLFKSWRNYLPKDLEELSTSQSAGNIPSVCGESPVIPDVTLSLPDIPSYNQRLLLRSASTSRCSSVSGTSGLGTSIRTDSTTFVDSDDVSMISDSGVSPCPSTCSLPPCTSIT